MAALSFVGISFWLRYFFPLSRSSTVISRNSDETVGTVEKIEESFYNLYTRGAHGVYTEASSGTSSLF